MTFMITTQNHYFTDSERPLSQTYSYQEATKCYQKLNSGYQNEIPSCTRDYLASCFGQHLEVDLELLGKEG